MIDRRTFLTQLGASPMLFGLRDLFGQESGSVPDWYRAALQRMKETRRWGLVLVAPKETTERVALGESLLARLEGEHPESLEIFATTVCILLRAEAAKDLLDTDANRILLDPDGRRLAADTIKFDACADPAKFAESFGAFVFGKDDTRLRAAPAPPAEVRAAIEKLDAEDFDEREAAVATLVKSVDACAAYLVLAIRAAPTAERRLLLRMALRRWFRERPRLPYGTERKEYRSGCGSIEQFEEEVAVRCGMAQAPRRSRAFLRLLTR